MHFEGVNIEGVHIEGVQWGSKMDQNGQKWDKIKNKPNLRTISLFWLVVNRQCMKHGVFWGPLGCLQPQEGIAIL